MNIEDVELKAQMQADVSDTLNNIQNIYKVDRQTARIILQISSECILTTVTDLIKTGAESGPFAMLQFANERKIGTETALSLLEDETL